MISRALYKVSKTFNRLKYIDLDITSLQFLFNLIFDRLFLSKSCSFFFLNIPLQKSRSVSRLNYFVIKEILLLLQIHVYLVMNWDSR